MSIVSTILIQCIQQFGQSSSKDVIQWQYNLATIGIMALVGIAALLLAGTWIYNIYTDRKRIKNEVNKVESHIINKATEVIKIETAKVKQELEKSFTNKFIEFEADKARLFAIVNKTEEAWVNEAGWWATAIFYYAQINNNKFLRISVNALYSSLKQIDKFDEIVDNWSIDWIKKCLPSIPDILIDEKNEIEKKFKELLDKKT